MAFCLPISGLNMDNHSLNLLTEQNVKVELASPSLNLSQDLIKPTSRDNVYSLSFQNIAEKHAPLLNLSQSANLLSLNCEDKSGSVSQPTSEQNQTLSNLLNLSNLNNSTSMSTAVTSSLLQASNLSLLTKLPFLNQPKQSDLPKSSESISTIPTTCLPLPIPSNLPLFGALHTLNYPSSPQSIPDIIAKLAAAKSSETSTTSSESSGLAADTLAKLTGNGLVSPNLSSLQIPDLASNIKLDAQTQKDIPFSTQGNGKT